MLSHEGLPPERKTLEYAWQMEIILGKLAARVTSIQVIRKQYNIFSAIIFYFIR